MYVCVPNTVNVTGLHKYKVCFGDLQIFIKNFVKLLISGHFGRFGVIGGGFRGRRRGAEGGGAGKMSGTAAAFGGWRGSGSGGYCLRGAGLCRQALDVSVARVVISSSTGRLPLTVSCRR